MGNFNNNRSGGGRGGNRFGSRDSGNRSFGGGDRDFGRPQMFRAICDNCGNSCEVPFKPSGDKPVFCSNCFQDKRESGERGERRERSDVRRYDRDDSREKEMFSATCDNCGDECQVPFRPTSGKPVYCSNCFEKKQETGFDRSGDNRGRDNKGGSNNNELKEQLNSLNAKLDRILSALESKVTSIPEVKAPQVVKEAAPKKVKEKAAPKAKKEAKPKAAKKKPAKK